jgi:hypothetical protein
MSKINIETKWCDMSREQKDDYIAELKPYHPQMTQEKLEWYAELKVNHPDRRSDYERERADFASRYIQIQR